MREDRIDDGRVLEGLCYAGHLQVELAAVDAERTIHRKREFEVHHPALHRRGRAGQAGDDDGNERQDPHYPARASMSRST